MDIILQSIEKIALTTHLLSINAAIEAEKSGPYGVAFAKVADQVRELARQTAGLSKQTATIMKENEKEIVHGADLIEVAESTVQQLADNFSEIGSAATSIADFSRQQSEGIDALKRLFRKIETIASKNQENAFAAVPVSHSMLSLAQHTSTVLEGLLSLTGAPDENLIEDHKNRTLHRQRQASIPVRIPSAINPAGSVYSQKG